MRPLSPKTCVYLHGCLVLKSTLTDIDVVQFARSEYENVGWKLVDVPLQTEWSLRPMQSLWCKGCVIHLVKAATCEFSMLWVERVGLICENPLNGGPVQSTCNNCNDGELLCIVEVMHLRGCYYWRVALM